MGVCGPTHDERSWTFDLDPGGRDPVLGIQRLQEAFLARFPDYPRGITVPAIVDVPTGQVVTNDFPQITLDLSPEWTAYHRDGAPDLYPDALRDEIDEVDARGSTPTSTTASTAAGSPAGRRRTSGPTTGCSPRSTGSRSG